MSKFLTGLLIGIILVPSAFYLYLRSGDAPVATWAPPMPLERFLVRTAMHATIDHEETPIRLTAVSDDSLVAGAQIYSQDCAVCHGLPGRAPTPVAEGMYPRPPQFFRPNAKKIDDPASEVYWKVKNGIRLTGMPGFRASLNEAQLRELTGFLEDAASLPPAAIAALKAAPENGHGQRPPSSRHAVLKHKKA
ncbi:MAG: cytochrome c [Acidobacteriota bacterium]